MWKRLLALLAVCLAAALFSGCGQSGQENNIKTQVVTDSIGRQVELQYPVTRAVVANAYNAELINAVGAVENIVGVDYNIYRDQTGFQGRFKENQIIGKSQRELNYEKIIELAPQVLILTGNGTYGDAEKKLGAFGIKVLVCDAYYTDKFAENCKLLGSVFGREKEAQELSDYFGSKLAYIRERLQNVPKKRVYYEYRRIGNSTVPGDYFYKMLEYAGADNIFKDAQNVEVDPEAIIKRNPDYIVKVSAVNAPSTYEPPTFAEHQAIKQELMRRPGWSSISAVQNDKILLMSHYVHGGASKIVGTMYTAKFLYPEELKELHPEQVFKDWLERYQHLPYVAGHTYPAYRLED